MPLLGTLREGETRQNGRDQHREEQRSKQREGDGPRHGLEKPALDTLQSEDGEIRSNNDADGVEDRALNFVRRSADALDRSLRCRAR